MNTILKYMKPYTWKIIVGFIIKFIGTIMELGLPWALAYVIDEVIPTGIMKNIFFWGIIMISFSIIALLNNIIANRMASRTASNVTRNLRHDLLKKILSLSNTQVYNFTIPSLVSRMTTDTYNVHSMVGNMQRIGVRAPVLLIGSIIVTLTLDPILTLVLIGILPFIAFIVYIVSKKGIPLYIEMQTKVDSMVQIVREDIAGIRVIKALSKNKYEKTRFSKANENLVEKETKASATMAITNPLMNLFLNIGLAMVILVGAYRVNNGSSQVGKIIAFTTYFTIMLNAMLGITRIFVMYSKAGASAQRIQQIFDAGSQLNIIEMPYEKDSEYHIKFENINFAYDNKKEDNICNINFSLKHGESLGIIGAIGSGKTTLLSLLLRFYDVDSGSIKIDGKDIRSIPNGEFRKKFGIVFQNDILFEDSIKENIIFGRNLTHDNVVTAAKHAVAEEFIEKDEKKYEKILYSKGANLSGGQKQRVLLSRALASKPEILILDDSSSALDYKTDSLLRKAIKENYKSTTAIIVAQRISSIMNLDNILVLDEGKQVGYGTHEELMKNCSLYSEIYESQLGGDDFE